MTTNPYTWIETFSLELLNNAYSTNCYKIQSTPYENILIMSCAEHMTNSSMYSDNYLVVANLSQTTTVSVIQTSYISVLIEVINDPTLQFPQVYVHDYQTIEIYQLVENNNFELNYVSEIDPESLNLSSFFVRSIMFINTTDLILVEVYNGFIWMKNENNVHSVYEIFECQSNINGYMSTYYTSAVLDKSTGVILATEVRGDVYKIEIGLNGLTLLSQYPPLSSNDTAIWINSITKYDDLIFYPI